MTSTVHTVTVDCADPARLAEFWSAALGLPSYGGAGWAAVGAEKQRGFRLLFMRVPEPKAGKNRLHLDLTPDGSRLDEVDRLVALGATLVADRGRWSVLLDPEGNEFCVLLSAAEKQARDDERDE